MLHFFSVRSAVRLTRAELALIGITMIWGATFLIVHVAVTSSGPLFFVGVRFVFAAAITLTVFGRSLRSMRWTEIGAGAAIGTMIFLGYALQTAGLQTISSSTSAFITALYVPLVPLLQWVVFHKRPSPMTVVGVVLAFAGLVLVAGPVGCVALGPGEIATLASTLPLAGEILLIGLFAGRVDLGRVTIVQLFVAGGLALATMPVAHESFPAFSWVWAAPAIALGASSCLIQLTMNWAQRTVSPTRATVIYSAEPLWGGLVGRTAGDRIPDLAVLGAALITIGVLTSGLRPRSRPSISHEINGTTSTNRDPPLSTE